MVNNLEFGPDLENEWLELSQNLMILVQTVYTYPNLFSGGQYNGFEDLPIVTRIQIFQDVYKALGCSDIGKVTFIMGQVNEINNCYSTLKARFDF